MRKKVSKSKGVEPVRPPDYAWATKAVEEWKAAYVRYTGQTSSLVRTLAISGIAAVWLFAAKADQQSIPGPADPTIVYKLPDGMSLALVGFVTVLFLDFCQYLLASIVWEIAHRLGIRSYRSIAQKVVDNEHQVYSLLRVAALPDILLFYAKCIAVIFAYCIFVRFAIRHIGF